jgi:hypothetical protein
VKYAEIEVERDGKEQKVKDKGDRRTGKKNSNKSTNWMQQFLKFIT